MFAAEMCSDTGISWNRTETVFMSEDGVEDVSIGMNLLH